MYNIEQIQDAIIKWLLKCEYKPTEPTINGIRHFISSVPEIIVPVPYEEDNSFEPRLLDFQIIFSTNNVIVEWSNLNISVETVSPKEIFLEDEIIFDMLFHIETFSDTENVFKKSSDAPQYLHDVLQREMEIYVENQYYPIYPFSISDLVNLMEKKLKTPLTRCSFFEIQSDIYIANHILEMNSGFIGEHFDANYISSLNVLSLKVNAFFKKLHRDCDNNSWYCGKTTMYNLFCQCVNSLKALEDRISQIERRSVYDDDFLD